MARRWVRPMLLLATALLSTAASCTGSDSTTDEADRTASAYTVIVDDLLTRQPVEPPEGEELPIVYLESFAEDGVPLEVQVAVVSALAEKAEVRFIDDVMEATDQELAPYAVKPGTILIGLGPIPEPPVEVQVEWYETSEDIDAYRYPLRLVGSSRWAIDGERTEAEPVGFVRPS